MYYQANVFIKFVLKNYLIFFFLVQEGGFYSAEDADSFPEVGATDKKEGAFYVWTYDEITELLSQPVEDKPTLILADLFAYYYHVKPNGNVDPSQVILIIFFF